MQEEEAQTVTHGRVTTASSGDILRSWGSRSQLPIKSTAQLHMSLGNEELEKNRLYYHSAIIMVFL